MLLRITIVQTNLVSGMRVCSWKSARNARTSCLRRCDERSRVNTCVNKSLFQRFQFPVVLLVSHRLNCCANIFSVFSAYYFTIVQPTNCSVNLCTFFHGDLMSAGLGNAYMDNQELDKIFCEPCSIHCYYGSASVLKWPQKQSQRF